MSNAHAERVARYTEWLQSRGVRFGFADEVPRLATNARLAVTNDTPPVELWHRMIPTLRLLERVRERFGPTTINSAYRSRSYNLAIGGVGDSRHSQNDAVDFRCRTGTPAEWAAFLREHRAAGVFQGGIGVYRTFVHVDTRGTNADWTG
jgi:uncharacterized protein YcbK (DUF882 family)